MKKLAIAIAIAIAIALMVADYAYLPKKEISSYTAQQQACKMI